MSKTVIPPESKFKFIDTEYELYMSILTHVGNVHFIGEREQFYRLSKLVFGRLPTVDESRFGKKQVVVGATTIIYDPHVDIDDIKVAIIDTKHYNKLVSTDRMKSVDRIYLI